MIDKDFTPELVIPPRSVLYCLPLSGGDGHHREALLDYAQRLSREHCVKVRHLFALIILPLANLPGVLSSAGQYSERHLRTCNGCSNYAVKFAGALNQLTCRTDLDSGTFLPWAGAFGYHATALLAPKRRWCPHCIEEQLARNEVRHYLHWAIDATPLCAIHRVPLQSHCANCGRTQPSVHDALALGCCTTCGASMANRPVRGGRVSIPSERDVYMADAVAELIGASDRAGGLAVPEHVLKRFTEAAEQLTDGSLARLEKRLNLSKGVMRHMSPKSLKMFLEITFRLGLKPMEFLTGSQAFSLDSTRTANRFVTHRRNVRKADASLRYRIRETLEAVTGDDETYTTTKDFCRRVGVTTTVLNNQFPEIARALVEYKRRVRPMFREKRRAAQLLAIESAMQGLVSNGGPFTVKGVSAALAKVRLSRRHPEVRKIAYARLAEIRSAACLSVQEASAASG